MGWQTTYKTKAGHVNRTAHWRDENGAHKSTTLGAVSVKHAAEYIAAREAEVERRRNATTIDVDHALEVFAAWAVDDRAEVTVRRYVAYLRPMLEAWAGEATGEWTAERFREHARTVPLKSRVFIVRAARAFLKSPAGKGIPDFTEGYRTRQGKPRVPDTLTRADRRRLIDAARDGPMAVPVALAAGMALRPKEWRRARHVDVRWADAALRVRRKGDFDQVLPIPPTVLAILKERGERPVLVGEIADRAPRVTLQRLHRLCLREGLPRVSWYGLRHTALTLMAEREPIHVVQRYAGHASIQTTQIYLHAQEHHLRRAADRDL